MANKKKLQGKASKQKKQEGMHMMPESHAKMTQAEHKKAMAKMEAKPKPSGKTKAKRRK